MKRILWMIAAVLTATWGWAQTGLHIQEHITDFYLFSEDSLYASYRFGNIERMMLINPTTKEWKYINTIDYTHDIGPFVMRTPLEGVMLTYDGSAHTVDGWQTATEDTTGMGFSQLVKSNAGYVAFVPTFDDLYFSADGANWTMAFDGGSSIGNEPLLRSHNNKVILASGTDVYYESTDGGQTWVAGNFSNFFAGNYFIEFAMISEDTFVLATDLNVFRTFDGGANWTTNATGTFTIRKIAVKNEDEMFVNTSPGTGTYFTTDGGATWTSRSAIDDYPLFYAGNRLMHWPEGSSLDNGQSWNYFLPRVSVTDIFDIYFKGNQGLLGLWDGKFITSVDQGRSLARELPVTGTGEDIMSVRILNNGDFLAADRNGQIFRSTDQGATWTAGNSNFMPNNPYKISTSANDSVIVVSCTGQPAFSTDHGQTFAIVSMGGGNHVNTVKPSGQIIDVESWFDYQLFQDKGWKVYSVTATGTKTQIDSFIAPQEVFVETFMVTENLGYLITTKNDTKETRIYKTTNGFNYGGTSMVGTISPVVSGIPNYNRAATRMQVFGTDTILLIGDGNAFYHYSYNGGATWNSTALDVHTTYPTYYPNLRRGFFFTPSTYLLGLHNHGLYLNTTGTTGPVAVEEPLESAISANGLLVYPNPAHDEIHLKLEGKNKLNLSIYNLSGTLITHLQDHPLSQGIDVSQLPSGVYFIVSLDEKGVGSRTRFVVP
jgi:photosystem II stability/assembly factor-like uncharacterized protein